MLTTIVEVCGRGHVSSLWPSIRGIPFVIIQFNWCFINVNFSVSASGFWGRFTWWCHESFYVADNRPEFEQRMASLVFVLGGGFAEVRLRLRICAIFGFSSLPQTTTTDTASPLINTFISLSLTFSRLTTHISHVSSVLFSFRGLQTNLQFKFVFGNLIMGTGERVL